MPSRTQEIQRPQVSDNRLDWLRVLKIGIRHFHSACIPCIQDSAGSTYHQSKKEKEDSSLKKCACSLCEHKWAHLSIGPHSNALYCVIVSRKISDLPELTLSLSIKTPILLHQPPPLASISTTSFLNMNRQSQVTKHCNKTKWFF